MRRVFIAFGIVVFLVYCWASVVYQNRVTVPDYALVEVDLLGGRSRSDWDADTRSQFQRLMELESRHYQLLEGTVIKAGVPGKNGVGREVHVDKDGTVPMDVALNSDDFAYLISQAPAGQGVRMKLRDPVAVYTLLGRNYLLRDSIFNPADPEGAPLFAAGQPLNKEMFDDLRIRGIQWITITGHAAPVNFQVGTAIMIAVIFLTLVAALKPVVWNPFLVLLEKRRRELEIGDEAERQNQQEAVRYEEESRRRYAELHREIQGTRMKGQNEAAKRAGEIVKTAREKEKAAKLEGLRALGDDARTAGNELDRAVPELAEAIVAAVAPGGRGGDKDRTES